MQLKKKNSKIMYTCMTWSLITEAVFLNGWGHHLMRYHDQLNTTLSERKVTEAVTGVVPY